MKKLTLIILLISTSLSLNASQNRNHYIINGFLCSDNPESMSHMVKYPFKRISDKAGFIKYVKDAQTQQGPYKIGKKCEGFTWDVSGTQARSSDGKVIVYFTLSVKGKIIDIKGRKIKGE